ncbi:hypothetical protein KAR91_86450 [Candidatus Pacearchaeota archaeon]|nr:hypothetical protein [Candidatus Pacearchaeota archaeon]
MSIAIAGSIDYTQIDALMAKLNTALTNRNLTLVAGRRVYKQVKSKYAERWKRQTDNDSIYQRTKREAAALGGTGFPNNNAEPGFLSGGTYRGIHLQNSELGAMVATADAWPGKDQPSFLANVPAGHEEGSQGGGKNNWASWFCGSSKGVEFYINGGWNKMANRISDGPIYLDGKDKLSDPAERVDWLILDNEDTSLVYRDVEKYLTGMIAGNTTLLKALFKSQKFTDKEGLGKTAQPIPEPQVAPSAGPVIPGKAAITKGLEQHYGSVEAGLRELGHASIDALIRHAEIMKETGGNV